MHEVEGAVDVRQGHRVGDHRVDLDLPVHVPVHELGDVGPAAETAERAAAPDAAGDELEGPGADLDAGAGDTDHHRLAPTLVAALEGLPHQGRVADALEGVVRAAVGEGDQVLDEVAVDLLGVDEVGHAHRLAEGLLVVVDVDADDHVGADHARALDHGEAHAAEAEDDDVGAGFHLGGVEDRAETGGHAAAEEADLVEGRVLADLGHGDLREDRVGREGRGAHEVMDGLAALGEAAGPIGHEPLALGRPDGLAEVGLGVQAELTDPALRGIEGDHVVPLLEALHARAHVHDDARALVAEHRGEETFGVLAAQGVGVGVADAGGLKLDEDLALLGAFELDVFDDERLLGLVRDGSLDLHDVLLTHPRAAGSSRGADPSTRPAPTV